MARTLKILLLVSVLAATPGATTAAARAIKFMPARASGVPVAQHVILEYYFNVY